MRAARPAALAIVLAAISTELPAQQGALEEVIVTATKRAESLQDIPVTVNAFSSEVIQEAGIGNASDLAIMTPSLTANGNFSPFNSRLQIRGIGTAQTDPALEPSVGLFVDGVFMGRTGLGMSDLTDIERIEVLQGPQGTLYGKNTNAGAISVITKSPNTEEFEGHVEASVGDYAMRKLTLSASAPVGNTVAYRLSGNIHQRDGYFDNAGGDDLNDADDWNLQAKLLWEPTDALGFLLSAAHVERDTTCCAADAVQDEAVNERLLAQGLRPDKNDPYDYDVAVDVDSRFEMESDLVSLTVDYDGGWGSIKSITAWNDYDYIQDTDADRSELAILSIQNDNFDGDSLSQELRFSSEFGDTIDYQVGLFYYDQTTGRGDGTTDYVLVGDDFIPIASQQEALGDRLGGVPVAFVVAPGDSLQAKVELENETLAAFGQATWNLADRWHLTGGLRWTDEEKKADLFSRTLSTAPSVALTGRSLLDLIATPIDANLKRSSDNVDWLVKAALDVGEESMVFASAATGSKSGGFNSVSGTAEEREFDDEDTMSYELGVKSTLLDATLRVNATLFYTEIDDYQFQQQLETGAGTFVSNEGEVETSGLDFQLEALPLPNLTLTAGLLYMHKYEVTAGPNEGQDLPFTADISANLGATLVFPLADGGLYLRADYSYMDDHITNTGSAEELRPKDEDDRNLLNMKLGWRNDHWNLSIWAKNLTDDEYASQTVNTFLFSGMDAYFLAPPRTWGATLRYDY